MGEGLRAGAAHVPGGIFIRGLPLDVTCGELEMCFDRYSKVLSERDSVRVLLLLLLMCNTDLTCYAALTIPRC